MKTEQGKSHATNLKRPRAPGPMWRVGEAYLVKRVERERWVMVLGKEHFLVDSSVKSLACRDDRCSSESKSIFWLYIMFCDRLFLIFRIQGHNC